MSRKDYIAVAAIIREAMATIREDVAAGNGSVIEADAPVLMIGEGLASYFAQDNERFDRQRFLEAADLLDPIPSEDFQAV